MSPDEFYSRLQSRIDRAVEKFSDGVESTQNFIFGRINTLIKDIELRGDKIRQNAKNRRLLREITRIVNQVIFSPAFQKKTDALIEDFNRLTNLSKKFYDVRDESFIRDLQQLSIKNVTELLDDGIKTQLEGPIKNILNQNISIGGTFTDLQDQLSTEIKGNSSRLGSMERYTKLFTNDSLSDFSASYNEAIANRLGLEFYKYIGPKGITTRQFCITRAGKFYHKKEVEAWGRLGPWDGKRPGTTPTSIFVFRGGYNCNHQLIGVSAVIVPRETVERAISKGFITPELVE